MDGHAVFRPADPDTFPDGIVPVLAWADEGASYGLCTRPAWAVRTKNL